MDRRTETRILIAAGGDREAGDRAVPGIWEGDLIIGRGNQTDIQIFFCDPRSPGQRGINENTNGLLEWSSKVGHTI